MRIIISFILLFISLQLLAQDMYTAVKEGNIDVVLKLFVDNPEKIETPNKAGYTPLMLAAYYNQKEIIQLLLDKGVAIDYKSKYGSALMAATVKGHIDIVTLLLINKANPNVKDTNGNTALLYAATFDQTAIAIALIKAGADIHHTDIRGNKALDYAIMNQNETIIKLLSKY